MLLDYAAHYSACTIQNHTHHLINSMFKQPLCVETVVWEKK